MKKKMGEDCVLRRGMPLPSVLLTEDYAVKAKEALYGTGCFSN